MEINTESGESNSTRHGVSVGIEEEYFIVDADTGFPVPQFAAVAGAVERWIEPSAEVTQSVIEVCTAPHESSELLRDELSGLRDGIAAGAETVGCRIFAGGTHPFGNPAEDRITPAARFLHLESEYGFLLREVATCGMHVHVGELARDEIAFLMRAARPYLPTLLAMSANSPFWRGTPSGMRSTRARLTNLYPRNGLPPVIESCEHYESIVASLIRSGSIREPKDIWWHLRPNESHGTLEFRIFDVQSNCDDAVALAMACVALAHVLLDRNHVPEMPEHLLEENMWTAARAGVEGAFARADGTPVPVRAVADSFVDLVEPMMRQHGADTYIDTLRGLAVCNGADQQLSSTMRGTSLRDLVVNTVSLHV